MISFLRSLIALALAGVLTVLTLGRVQLNRTGKPTATDDEGSGGRPAASQPVAPEASEPTGSRPAQPVGPGPRDGRDAPAADQFIGATRSRR